MRKKFISLALAFVMVLGLIPGTAFASEAPAAGGEEAKLFEQYTDDVGLGTTLKGSDLADVTFTKKDTSSATEDCSVTFNGNKPTDASADVGSLPSTMTLKKGTKITEPTAPTLTGYTFSGWYTEAGCTTAWNFSSDTVSGDTTLYAKWTKEATKTYTAEVAIIADDEALLGDKKASEMIESGEIGADGKVTGTPAKLTLGTAFSSVTAYQEGYYLPLQISLGTGLDASDVKSVTFVNTALNEADRTRVWSSDSGAVGTVGDFFKDGKTVVFMGKELKETPDTLKITITWADDTKFEKTLTYPAAALAAAITATVKMAQEFSNGLTVESSENTTTIKGSVNLANVQISQDNQTLFGTKYHTNGKVNAGAPYAIAVITFNGLADGKDYTIVQTNPALALYSGDEGIENSNSLYKKTKTYSKTDLTDGLTFLVPGKTGNDAAEITISIKEKDADDSAATTFTIKSETTVTNAAPEKLGAGTLTGAILNVNDPAVKNITVKAEKDASDESKIKVTLDGTNQKLPLHKNASGVSGYWVGFALTAPEGAKQMKVAFNNSALNAENALTNVTAGELEENVAANGAKGVAFYANLDDEQPKKYAAVQWLPANDDTAHTASDVAVYEMDTSGIDCEPGLEIAISTETIFGQAASGMGTYAIAETTVEGTTTTIKVTGTATWVSNYEQWGVTSEVAGNYLPLKITAHKTNAITSYNKTTGAKDGKVFDVSSDKVLEMATYLDGKESITANGVNLTDNTFQLKAGGKDTTDARVYVIDYSGIQKASDINAAMLSLFALSNAPAETAETYKVKGTIEYVELPGFNGTVAEECKGNYLPLVINVPAGVSTLKITNRSDGANGGKDHTVTPGSKYATIIWLNGKQNNTGLDDKTIKVEMGGKTYILDYSGATLNTAAQSQKNVAVAGNIANGKVITTPGTNAVPGAVVTVTATPDTGYELDKITVKTGNTMVDVTSENKFSMPAGDVTVSATFKPTFATLTVTDLTKATLGKDNPSTDLGQFHIQQDGHTITVTGKANYVASWEEFSSVAAEQKGNYLPIQITADKAGKVTITGNGDPQEVNVTADDLGIELITRLNAMAEADPAKTSFSIHVANDPDVYSVDFKGVKLAAAKESGAEAEATVTKPTEQTVAASVEKSIIDSAIQTAKRKAEQSPDVAEGSAVVNEVTIDATTSTSDDKPITKAEVTLPATAVAAIQNEGKAEDGTGDATIEKATIQTDVATVTLPVDQIAMIESANDKAEASITDNGLKVVVEDVKPADPVDPPTTPATSTTVAAVSVELKDGTDKPLTVTNLSKVIELSFKVTVTPGAELKVKSGANYTAAASGTELNETADKYNTAGTAGVYYLAEGTLTIWTDHLTVFLLEETVTTSPTEYNITKATATNGSFTVKVGAKEMSKAAAGTTVTITATPAAGYEVGTIKVTKVDGGEVNVTDNKFTMPAEAVTVTVNFKERAPVSATVTYTPDASADASITGGYATVTDSSITANAKYLVKVERNNVVVVTIVTATEAGKLDIPVQNDVKLTVAPVKTGAAITGSPALSDCEAPIVTDHQLTSTTQP